MLNKVAAAIFIVGVCFAAPNSAWSVEPDEVLSDSGLETRARLLSSQIRCLVCQNQSIDDSNAPLARDLRVLVREKLTEGLSDPQILDHLVARYGEFVLLKPRFGGQTIVLWLLPLIVLLIGVCGGAVFFRSSKAIMPDAKALSKREQEALTKILDESD